MGLSSFVPATPAERDEILDYLYPDLGNCLYLYLDIDNYEIGGSVIDVWLQRDDESIVAVTMRYSDSFQLYAREEDLATVDYVWIANAIRELDVMRISAPAHLVDHLKELDAFARFEASYGTVMEMVKYRPFCDEGIVIEDATVDDIPEVIDLIMMDEELKQGYDRDEMITQFATRLEDGTGRDFIIRNEGKVVAHLGLSAISDKFVIAAYTIVHPDYRSYPYGAFLDSNFINNILPGMGKRGFAFMQDPRRIRLFEIMGNPIVAKYGKLNRYVDE